MSNGYDPSDWSDESFMRQVIDDWREDIERRLPRSELMWVQPQHLKALLDRFAKLEKLQP